MRNNTCEVLKTRRIVSTEGTRGDPQGAGRRQNRDTSFQLKNKCRSSRRENKLKNGGAEKGLRA